MIQDGLAIDRLYGWRKEFEGNLDSKGHGVRNNEFQFCVDPH